MSPSAALPAVTESNIGNVFLTGFMGTGKTAVGRELARLLGFGFIDTDDEIERAAGRRISQIFREDGEGAFRALERAAIAEVCGLTNVVVATGGGAILDPANRDRMTAAGRIVCLEATPETILERVGSGEDRPLLHGASDPLRRIRELLEARATAYGDVPLRIQASRGSPAEVAAEIVRRLEERA